MAKKYVYGCKCRDVGVYGDRSYGIYCEHYENYGGCGKKMGLCDATKYETKPVARVDENGEFRDLKGTLFIKIKPKKEPK